jgi:hypothetical protein
MIMNPKSITFSILGFFSLAMPTTLAAVNVLLSELPYSSGATRTVLTFGPFHTEPHTMYPHTPYVSEQKPCIDCYLVRTQVELQYLNGTSANFNNGAALHHFMQFTIGESDPICPSNAGNLFLVSGNERNIWELNSNGPYGYYVGSTGNWVTAPAIMNVAEEPSDLQIQVTYEWIPANSTQGQQYRNVELLWVNIGDPCGDGMIPMGSVKTGVQKFTSAGMTAPLGGPIIAAEGHLHDGGVNTTLFINGNTACTSTQLYDSLPGFTDRSGGMHTTGSSGCEEIGPITKGDQLHIEAAYDLDKAHVLGGPNDEIMAVMFLYVGLEEAK